MIIIKNTTPFDTKALKNILWDSYNEIKKDYGNLTFHGMNINQFKILLRNKFVGYSGSCYLGDMYGEGKQNAKKWNFNYSGNEKHMVCSISYTCELSEIIQLFGHEFLHAYGLAHKEFPNAYNDGWADPHTKEFIEYCKDQYFDKYNILKGKYVNEVNNYA